MDPWGRAEHILRSRVVATMSDPQRGEAWLAALKSTGDDGLLLAHSMAIDVLNGTVDAVDLAQFFADHEPGEHVMDLLDGTDSIPAARCLEPGIPYEHGGYVRIVELGGFVDKYLRRPVDPENVEIVRHEFLKDARANCLSEVRNAWSGRKGRVWVLPKNEFLDMRREQKSKVAAFLNDVLGLGYDRASYAEHPEFIVVFYPDDFEERFATKPRQPTCFDASWTPAGFYISYVNEDGWGRTQSCSGAPSNHRERVHMKIEALTDEFTLEWLGVAATLHFDHAQLNAAAERRLEEAETRLARLATGGGKQP